MQVITCVLVELEAVSSHRIIGRSHMTRCSGKAFLESSDEDDSDDLGEDEIHDFEIV